MRRQVNLTAVAAALLIVAAGPALAQSIDLSPVQTLLQGIVDAITGPLGIVIGTLALIGVFLSWLFGILDFRQALWVVVAIAGIAAAPTIDLDHLRSDTMADQSRVFIGLLRPPKLMGLPIMYAMVWLFGSTLLFLWVQSWVVVLIAGIAWPALWKAADWDPNFLDVLVITLQETPPTRNRKLHGGDSYAP